MVGLGALGALGGITGLGGLPAPPSGLQLVRDPATGTLLLIPPPTGRFVYDFIQ